MKKLSLFLCLILTLTSGFSQGLNLFGLRNTMPNDPANPANSFELVVMDPLTTSVIPILTIPNSNAAAYSSKAFDHSRQHFLFWGFDDFSQKVFYTVATDSSSISSVPIVSNPIFGTNSPKQMEYDLQADTTYALMWDNTAQKEYFVTVSMQNGTIDTVAYLPGVGGTVNLSSAFNSNHHRYIFQGFDANNTVKLYYLDAINGDMLYSPTLSKTLLSLAYDNNSNKLYGMYSQIDSTQYDPMAQRYYHTLHWGEVDSVTGVVSPLSATPILGGFNMGFRAGSDDYDQLSSTFVCVANDDNFDSRLLLIDGVTGQVVSDTTLNEDIKFIQCDNHVFATRMYDPTSSIDPSTTVDLLIYPNPVSDILKVEFQEEMPAMTVRLIDLTGRTMVEQNVSKGDSELEIPMRGLAEGRYWLVGTHEAKLQFMQQVVKR